MTKTPSAAIGRTASQMQADHQTLDASTIAESLGMWLLRIDAPVGQYVRGGELYCVPGSETPHLKADGMFFVKFGQEQDAAYYYEGTICDLTPATDRLDFSLTLVDPNGRIVARYEQTRTPKRAHNVQTMRADFERRKIDAKVRLPIAA